LTCAIAGNGDDPGPFGAKGCGEGPLATIVSALAASGVPMNTLPLTPERVWRGVQELRSMA
jgi:CO/xanthine dehydrogenase Mo-binding subunit